MDRNAVPRPIIPEASSISESAVDQRATPLHIDGFLSLRTRCWCDIHLFPLTPTTYSTAFDQPSFSPSGNVMDAYTREQDVGSKLKFVFLSPAKSDFAQDISPECIDFSSGFFDPFNVTTWHIASLLKQYPQLYRESSPFSVSMGLPTLERPSDNVVEPKVAKLSSESTDKLRREGSSESTISTNLQGVRGALIRFSGKWFIKSSDLVQTRGDHTTRYEPKVFNDNDNTPSLASGSSDLNSRQILDRIDSHIKFHYLQTLRWNDISTDQRWSRFLKEMQKSSTSQLLATLDHQKSSRVVSLLRGQLLNLLFSERMTNFVLHRSASEQHRLCQFQTSVHQQSLTELNQAKEKVTSTMKSIHQSLGSWEKDLSLNLDDGLLKERLEVVSIGNQAFVAYGPVSRWFIHVLITITKEPANPWTMFVQVWRRFGCFVGSFVEMVTWDTFYRFWHTDFDLRPWGLGVKVDFRWTR